MKASPCHCVVSSKLMVAPARDLHIVEELNVCGSSVLHVHRKVQFCTSTSFLLPVKLNSHSSYTCVVYILCVFAWERAKASLWLQHGPGALCLLCTQSLCVCPHYYPHTLHVCCLFDIRAHLFLFKCKCLVSPCLLVILWVNAVVIVYLCVCHVSGSGSSQTRPSSPACCGSCVRCRSRAAVSLLSPCSALPSTCWRWHRTTAPAWRG